MADIDLTQGDTAPAAEATLTQKIDGVETPIDLTGCTVTIIMYSKTALVETSAVTIVSATAGQVRYDWDADDTLIAGSFKAKWRGVTPAGKKFTVPNKGWFTVDIEALAP